MLLQSFFKVCNKIASGIKGKYIVYLEKSFRFRVPNHAVKNMHLSFLHVVHNQNEVGPKLPIHHNHFSAMIDLYIEVICILLTISYQMKRWLQQTYICVTQWSQNVILQCIVIDVVTDAVGIQHHNTVSKLALKRSDLTKYWKVHWRRKKGSRFLLHSQTNPVA